MFLPIHGSGGIVETNIPHAPWMAAFKWIKPRPGLRTNDGLRRPSAAIPGCYMPPSGLRSVPPAHVVFTNVVGGDLVGPSSAGRTSRRHCYRTRLRLENRLIPNLTPPPSASATIPNPPG